MRERVLQTSTEKKGKVSGLDQEKTGVGEAKEDLVLDGEDSERVLFWREIKTRGDEKKESHGHLSINMEFFFHMKKKTCPFTFLQIIGEMQGPTRSHPSPIHRVWPGRADIHRNQG